MSKIIAFEGVDYSGKSSIINAIKNKLENNGKTVLVISEPGTTPMGKEIRKILKSNIPRSKETELFLQEAARRDIHDMSIWKNKDKYDYLLLDRYIYSTIAYQVAGNGNSYQKAKILNSLATDNLMPDLAILITAEKDYLRSSDQIDKYDQHFINHDEFSDRVKNSYLGMVAKGELIQVINPSNNQSIAVDKCLNLIFDL